MQKELAQRLLSATLNWGDEEIEKYLEIISNFAELKYDEYQQYRPGNRFLENLSAWLNQFDKGVDRNTALGFVLNKLVFISSSEMHRLIETVYPEIIRPIFRSQASAICDKNSIDISNQDAIIDLLKTKSLFLALSDGARIDILRRSAALAHDQVCVSYDLSEEKYEELVNEMNHRVDIFNSKTGMNPFVPDGFNHVFLLDDFSGSGISYLRIEDGARKGKISRVINSFLSTEGKQGSFKGILKAHTKIHIVLYLATEKALNNIRKSVAEAYSSENIDIDVSYVQIVNPTVLSPEEEVLFKKHYDLIREEVEDTHYCKGNMERPHYGFDGCGLALVIHHNTPNNSFPVLWAGENALFPRVTRHKDVR